MTYVVQFVDLCDVFVDVFVASQHELISHWQQGCAPG